MTGEETSEGLRTEAKNISVALWWWAAIQLINPALLGISSRTSTCLSFQVVLIAPMFAQVPSVWFKLVTNDTKRG